MINLSKFALTKRFIVSNYIVSKLNLALNTNSICKKIMARIVAQINKAKYFY